MRRVIVFDGVCNLCNGWVDFVIQRDSQQRFQFTANQHQAGIQLLQDFGVAPEAVETVYLIEGDQLYSKSTAALRILRGLGGIYAIGYAAIIVPTFIRDRVYNLIARNRYRWFGKKESCRLPTPQERMRFLI